MSKSLTLYDIPSTLLNNAWSPNGNKVRYVINYKGLPYRTEWVEFPHIEALYKKLGVQASATKADGITPHYTLPLLYDPSTGAFVSDSAAIVRYLDKIYPETPTVIPAGTDAFHYAFHEALVRSQSGALRKLVGIPATFLLNPVSEEYYRRTREANAFGGRKLEDVSPKGEDRKREWARVKEDLGKVNAWYGKGDRYVMGDTVSYADFTVSASILWIRTVCGADSEEWKDILTWHEGRWGTLVKDFEKYETVL
ncbi:uncharacterized protein BT62DRAFT_934559 [Guyanagaster necrorhizus]|uniref:GST N-terminal domain-containing protein n=1 Tax=Guyanagaster necrorhizus TaxID=856835 RepID=A0A9P8AQC8_9AGAR|nr:uncharacterized protein BT62DRAFT_934559 [Guyanagaster necrorhizus MCA 3950]KAG7443974.1 hypothetical protein BT62DRAFT_934559 [Guyanagaster necrorhizus MCA 3950]